MKQTAVQWLVEKYAIVMGLGSKELMKEHIERAKQMEKKQIMDAYEQGSYDMADKVYNPDQYYKETYETI